MDDINRVSLVKRLQEFEHQEHGLAGYARALDTWQRLQDLLDLNTGDASFKTILSKTQYKSYLILSEWWSGSIQDDSFKAAARLSFQESIDAEKNDPGKIQLASRQVALLSNSVYHGKLFLLFELELLSEMPMFLQRDEASFHVVLQYQREQAAAHAAMQRIGYASMVAQKSDASISSEDAESSHKTRNLPSLLASAIGACADPCPWLKPRTGEDALPYFLWDVEAKKTVVVHELGNYPEYVCVSHTWGRWALDEEPFLEIPGVPWLVPQNSKFDVAKLPDELTRAFETGYVWFDLLCIPQDRSKRSLIEIARQAIIFGNASFALAWLNEIDSWSGLRGVIEWLGLFYLSTTITDEHGEPAIIYELLEPDERLKEKMELYDWSTGDVARQSIYDESPLTIAAPNPWFTSLWTLQEACLRPDLVLCNKSWQVLTIGSDVAVTLDHLATLDDYISRGILSSLDLSEEEAASGHTELPKPSGARDLTTLLVDTCMKDLLTMPPAAVFTFGQMRKCKQSRAEAIMSVVGATEWFENLVATGNQHLAETNLVLGLYPLAFVRESATKLGPSFYTALQTDARYLTDVVDLTSGEWVCRSDPKAVGSMMPFNSTPGFLHPPHRLAISEEAHDSIRQWIIQGDGSVKMSVAGIVSKDSIQLETEPNKDQLYAPLLNDDNSLSYKNELAVTEGHNLKDWLDAFANAESAPNYAICLYQQNDFAQSGHSLQVGLLLKQVEISGAQRKLVKIGMYFSRSYRVSDIPSTNVDWIVL